MDDPKESTYLTAEQVAELKQVSLSTIKRATSAGILKSHRIKTKKNQQRFTRRYTLADVERWRSSIHGLATDEHGYFINSTGKTVRQLISDADPDAAYALYYDAADGGSISLHLGVVGIEDVGFARLTDDQILEIDPDEKAYSLGSARATSIGKTRLYQRIRKTRPYQGIKKEAQARESKANEESAANLQKDFDDWKVEPSEPVESILDIFKNY